ncbi:MAG: hypothetical protein PHT31_06370 [Candidatus Omnitrophica bacterium]|nr:hypothetical protein [Candidatus Omnitrophota bacterium]MDD5653761.1 hypothetical protein [Candidatus Omnitrophota bacterium]
MPITNFEGNTFVAFLDISGFKEMVKHQEKAWLALDRFYQLGYNILRRQNDEFPRVDGLFISDCGILFAREGNSVQNQLSSLLSKIEKINKGMLEEDVMLTTSIAFGPFKYQERIEFSGIEKNPVFGSAYIAAYLDSANGKPAIQPGQCRILMENLPNEVIGFIENGQQEITRRIQRVGTKHYFFYWNVRSPHDIEGFIQRYHDSYNLKYSGMLKALKGEND